MRTLLLFIKSCGIRLGLVFGGACKKFYLDNCFLYTASLTYHSLLSIVPVIAMAFAIAKGFGMEAYLRNYLLDTANQNKIFLQILAFSDALLNRTKGGIIAGIGTIILLWSIWSVLHNIESSFNIIWKTKNERPILRKLTDYVSIMFLSPIVLILALGGAIYIESFVKTIVSPFHYDYTIMYALRRLLLPMLFLILLFTGLYMVIPNTRVPFTKALFGGAFTGITFELFTYLYIHYQIKLTNYNVIYGSLAALPLLFLWLYYTWVLILLGMEIVIIHNNYSVSRHKDFDIKLSAYHKKLLSLAILKMIIEDFKQPQKSTITLTLLSKRLTLPLKTTEKLLSTLTDLGYITKITEKEHIQDIKDPCFQPAYDINKMRIGDILLALDKFSVEHKFSAKKHSEKHTQKIHNLLEQLNLMIQNDQHNIYLSHL